MLPRDFLAAPHSCSYHAISHVPAAVVVLENLLVFDDKWKNCFVATIIHRKWAIKQIQIEAAASEGSTFYRRTTERATQSGEWGTWGL